MTDFAATHSHQPDNLLGICHRVGEDFGFNPLWLRLALGAVFVFNPVGVIAFYLALGGLVAVSRVLFPNRRRSAEVVTLPAPADVVEQPALAKAA